MKGMTGPRPAKVQTEFTDALLTGCGGWSVLGRLAERLGLLNQTAARHQPPALDSS